VTGRRKQMKKTMKFKNIHSLEDIHKVRLQLEKKMRLTEKSISEKTDLGMLFLDTFEKMGVISSDRARGTEFIDYLLPLGLQYTLSLIKKNTSRKQFRQLLLYSTIGGVLSFFVYHLLGKGKTDTEK
jgi:hypothetical protein